MPLMLRSRLESRVRGRKAQTRGHETIQLFEPKYHPGETLADQLLFALKYEGVNLQVLALLFEKTGADEISQWLKSTPSSAYARRAGFLFEWLTGAELEHETPERSRYIPVLDDDLQFAAPEGERNKRYRVIDNLPGCQHFCPMIRKSEALRRWTSRNLKESTRKIIGAYDPDLLRRAAAFLYLKETQSSFELEREKPSPNKAQRFADLLRQAEVDEELTVEKLAELQNAVIDPRFHECFWRSEQNWIGDDLGYRQNIALVPARPEDLPELMGGLLLTANRARTAGWLKAPPQASEESKMQFDPIMLAAMVAFGFVFIHPFMDGNGRIHRYLIHHILAQAGFTPTGIVLPVSAVILANLDRYLECLETFSKPLVSQTEYDPRAPKVGAKGNDAVYFRFFDATPQAEFLYWALERTVTEDLPQEIDFLLGFDRAR
ncbi:MAG: Fic family protein, partial [Gammaproteobacteria bacterium]